MIISLFIFPWKLFEYFPIYVSYDIISNTQFSRIGKLYIPNKYMCLNVSSNYLNHMAKQSENLLAETKNGVNLLCYSCP